MKTTNQNIEASTPANDRVIVTLFESKFRDFAQQPLPVHKVLADRQFQNLKQLGTSGGTEMAPALKHVLDVASKYNAGRDKKLILITDTQIGNESAILNLMRTAADMAVHCCGVVVCHALEHVDSSTSTERLDVLRSEVQQRALELLKHFAETLLAPKAMQ